MILGLYDVLFSFMFSSKPLIPSLKFSINARIQFTHRTALLNYELNFEDINLMSLRQKNKQTKKKQDSKCTFNFSIGNYMF